MMQCLSRFFVPKRIISILLVLILLGAGIFFWKNRSESSPEQLTDRITANLSGPWSAKLQIQYGDFAALCDFKQQYVGDSSFQFLSPVSLDGFGLTVKDEEVTLSYRDMSCSMSADRLFHSSGAGMFLDGIDSILKKEGLKAVLDEETGLLTLSVPSAEGEEDFLSMTFDQSAAPLSLCIPQEDFTVKITDFVPAPLPETDSEKPEEKEKPAEEQEQETEKVPEETPEEKEKPEEKSDGSEK